MQCESNKKSLSQYFTKRGTWLRAHIIKFIEESGCTIACDPFAGDGDIFKQLMESAPSIRDVFGLDIDSNTKWTHNDSLVSIPKFDDAIIITNPPYMSKSSASRKKLKRKDEIDAYFSMTRYDDLYLLALERMVESYKNVVAIIPETFINSNFDKKNLLKSITIIEENPFTDTEVPVCVACFDSIPKDFSEIRMYVNDDEICTLHDVESSRLTPTKNYAMKFNDSDGWLAVRCIDLTDDGNMIEFSTKDGMDYDWNKGLKQSSRLYTLISVDVDDDDRDRFVNRCNSILSELRKKSHDMVLSPFKGNMKNGHRRRRLDFSTCRAIVEQSLQSLTISN